MGLLKEISRHKFKLNKSQIEEMQKIENYKEYYYSFLRLWKNIYIEQIFACRYKRKKFEFQEVQRRIEGTNDIIIRNMYFSRLAGYKVVWDDSRPSYYLWNSYDKDIWFISDRKYYNVFRFNNFNNLPQYCGYKTGDVTNYIYRWKKYPQLEMLSKLGYVKFINNDSFVKKCSDKKFVKWLTKQDIPTEATSIDILSAYKNNISVKQICINKSINKQINYVLNEKPFIDKEKLFKYWKNNYSKLSPSLYLDLINAETELMLDLEDTKNIFPKDFNYWHDFYTQQIRAIKNKEIDSKMDKVYNRWCKKINKYDNDFYFILAHNSSELIEEGNILKHCVGRMGYNKKMADNKSLIIFIRKDKNTPLYTMEYDHHNKKIIQLYGTEDSSVNNEDKAKICYAMGQKEVIEC